jgi:hypothetical protein
LKLWEASSTGCGEYPSIEYLWHVVSSFSLFTGDRGYTTIESMTRIATDRHRGVVMALDTGQRPNGFSAALDCVCV